ncbi:NUDIX domain-containing protein [Dysgonomonas sp. 216]|uniref:NUDIX hydrolase n=1 Tax=Dysgonomonas sp. 216 TaxID=2302934 RepID=UPI0013D61EAE|nr:NUDIX domain-containing protein [Dysgonomonas sp. 216]NDW17791.1 NUDIX domain-containing protein [Dysgonomonas sp. 216]
MTPGFYKDQEKLHVSVDCIILGFKNDKLYLLLIKRKFEPLKGQESLMGGFIRSNENLTDAVSRTVYEYTGITDMFMEQIGAYGDIGRDIGERVISIAYYALINIESYDEELSKIHNTRWVELEEVGDLIFDHKKILDDTITMLRKQAISQPIGLNLLPEKFTLPQLHSLYEAIYQKTLDKRNLRKKIAEMDILEKLDEKDKSSSKKGAYYYRFNKDKYNQLMERGYYISL